MVRSERVQVSDWLSGVGHPEETVGEDQALRAPPLSIKDTTFEYIPQGVIHTLRVVRVWEYGKWS